MSKPMTNYNERLDEVVWKTLRRHKKMLNGPVPSDILYSEKEPTDIIFEGAKQALTSLTKELVAEAKPKDYVPDGHGPDACLNHEKYTSACCGCQNQRARVHAINEFEQNLLKALEEV